LSPGSAFSRSTFNPEAAGCVMVRMLEEAGVKALYGTAFVDTVVKSAVGGDSITEVIVENAAGRQAIRGKVFIEGSGTAEVVARSGAPFVRGGGRSPPMSHRTESTGRFPAHTVDHERGRLRAVAAYQRRENDPTLAKLIAAARAAGTFLPTLPGPRLRGTGTGAYGNHYIGHPTPDMSPIQGPGTFVFWQNVPYEWALHMDDDAEHAARAKMAMRELHRCGRRGF